MKKVVMVWGLYKGQTGVITREQGKNLIVKLDAGFEIDASTDHVEEVKEVTIFTNVTAGEIKVGDMMKRYNDACKEKVVVKTERRGADSVKITVGYDGNKTYSYTIRLSTTVYKVMA